MVFLLEGKLCECTVVSNETTMTNNVREQEHRDQMIDKISLRENENLFRG